MSLSPVLGARVAGLLAGLGLVGIVALGAWRVPASGRPATVGVDVRALSSGEVGAEPAGSVVGPAELVPGGPAVSGRVRLSNRTAAALAARPRVTGGERELDAVVSLTLTVAGRVVYRGPMGGLRDGVSTPVLLPRGGGAVVGVRAHVPEGSAADRAALRSGRWTLTFAGEASR